MKRETADCLVMYVYGRIEGGRIVVRKEPKEQKEAQGSFGFFPGGAPEEMPPSWGGKPWVSGRGGGGGPTFSFKAWSGVKKTRVRYWVR